MNLDFNAKRGFICDMDGVIYHGNRVLPGVAEFIQWLQDEEKEFLFPPNNRGYTPPELQPPLARPAPPDPHAPPSGSAGPGCV